MFAKKLMILAIAFCALQVARTRVAAADPCFGLVCNTTPVAKLYPTADAVNPKVYVKVKDGGEAALSCTTVSGQYLTLKATHPLFAEIFSTLLNATISNKRVTFRIVQNSTDCEIAYVVLDNS